MELEMANRYRKTTSFAEIKSLLLKPQEEESIMWKNIGTERVRYAVSTISWYEDSRELRFGLREFDERVNKHDTVYFRLPDRDTIFKVKVSKIDGSFIYFKIPEEVMTLELRREPRVEFKVKDEKWAKLDVAQSQSDQGSLTSDMKFTVLDISRGGICLMVSVSNKNFVNEAEEIVLTHLGEVKLENPLTMNLRYSEWTKHRVNGKEVKSMRIGFQFLETLQEVLFEEFSAAS